MSPVHPRDMNSVQREEFATYLEGMARWSRESALALYETGLAGYTGCLESAGRREAQAARVREGKAA